MKRSVFRHALIFGVALLAVASGCKHTPKGPTPIPGKNTPVSGNDTASQPISPIPPSLPGGNDNNVDRNPITRPAGEDPNALPTRDKFDKWPQYREILQAYTAYFDFDRYNVKSSETSKLEAVASYLKSHPAELLIIEGHCDERGTEEYNRALGERRALSLREYLVNLGISGERMLTKSFGEDRPAVEGHDEAAYSKNRRGEFVVVKEK
ncbi:MAG TPA: OmpA family protein [Verrucomicrobiae bacterium]|nr:OmpA family protein [Verrucomicrobiae bacterium]